MNEQASRHDAGAANSPPIPAPGARAAVRETHSAIVLLAGDRAYKIKKPVNLGFLDFRSEQVRRDVCRREVELNRRLAPDVYLDTISVAGSDGRTYEHGVLMRRMPEDLRLSTMVEQGLAVEAHLRSLAGLLARFHASADRGPQIAAEGTIVGLWHRWVHNLRETEVYRRTILAEDLHDRIRRFALRYVDGRAPLLAERAAAGLVVDGHGDLIAEDIFCLPDYPRVLDCLEFDDLLRWVDVLDDAAFLAMDLEHLGRPDLAQLFLRCYLESSGTPSVASLEHHYIAYRAFVRAKVACIQASQGQARRRGRSGSLREPRNATSRSRRRHTDTRRRRSRHRQDDAGARSRRSSRQRMAELGHSPPGHACHRRRPLQRRGQGGHLPGTPASRSVPAAPRRVRHRRRDLGRCADPSARR